MADACVGVFALLILACILGFFTWSASFRFVAKHQQGIHTRRGKIKRLVGPGKYYVWPLTDVFYTVDMRSQNLDASAMDLMTIDKQRLGMDVFMKIRVIEAEKALFGVTNYKDATCYSAIAVAGDVVSEMELEVALSSKTQIQSRVLHELSSEARRWGVEVDDVHVRFWEVDPGFCPACGQVCPPESKVCSRCGKKLVPVPSDLSERYRMAMGTESRAVGAHKIKMAYAPDNLNAPYEVEKGFRFWRKRRN